MSSATHLERHGQRLPGDDDGLLVFDDSLWPLYQNEPQLNPKLAIDAFVNCHLSEIRYTHVPQTSQFCLRKAKP